MGPCKFKDLLKGPSDLLSDDFTSKKSVKTKFVAPIAGGITFTSEDEVKTSDALVLKSIAGKLSGKWKHKASGVSVDKLELKGTDVKLEVSYPVAGFKTKVKTAVESGSIGATSAECEKGLGVGTFFGALSSKKVDLSLNTSLAKVRRTQPSPPALSDAPGRAQPPRWSSTRRGWVARARGRIRVSSSERGRPGVVSLL